MKGQEVAEEDVEEHVSDVVHSPYVSAMSDGSKS